MMEHWIILACVLTSAALLALIAAKPETIANLLRQRN